MVMYQNIYKQDRALALLAQSLPDRLTREDIPLHDYE